MTNTQQIMDETEQYVLHTYNRFPVAFERGEGVRLYDVEERNTWTSAPESRYLHWATETARTMTR